MIEEREIRIGDRVRMKGEDKWFTVQRTTIENIKTIHKGELKFIKLYFGPTDHRPVWDYEVEEVEYADDNS